MSNSWVKLATAICALVSLSFGVARAESNWQRFTTAIPGGGSVSVELPQAPKYQSVQDVAGRVTYTVHVWSVELDQDRAYLVSVGVYSVDLGEANARRLLEGGLKAGATRTSSGQWTSVAWKQHQGLLAYDAVGTTRAGRDIRVYSVKKGAQVFTLTSTGLAGSAQSADINRFIASLRIQ
jgi:hypothetical protein